MTDAQTNRRLRDRLLVVVALIVYLAFLGAWEIDNLRAGTVEPFGVFILGMLLGAMTWLGFVARHRWRLYMSSRE